MVSQIQYKPFQIVRQSRLGNLTAYELVRNYELKYSDIPATTLLLSFEEATMRG